MRYNARATDRGDWNLTDGEKALKTRAFNDSEFLGEQFGEQFGIKEQILTLFEKLGADEQEQVLSLLLTKTQNIRVQ